MLVTMSNDADSLRTTPKSIKAASSVTTGTNVSNGHYKNNYGKNITPTNYNSRNRRYNKGTIYINIVFILIAFLALIQMFDPAIQNPIPKNDVLHQHIRNQHPPTNPSLPTDNRFTTKSTDSNKQASSSSLSHKQSDRILSLLNDAGIINELSDAQREHIPRWDQV
jgi:cytoskeletal protein RodZ